eukprot:190476-Hanusia_phi.AAC.1
MVATYNITIERIINNEIKQAADHTNSFRDVEGDILTNDVHSLPIPESVILQAISELTDGAKLAVETCYDLWKEQKFGTEEFISFIKCYSSQSSTLALVFKDGSQNPETSASSTGGSVDAMTGCSSDTFSSSLEATDKGRLSASKKQKDSSGSSPQTAGSDSDKGSNEKGYMASASESNGHSSNGHSSNGCESGNRSVKMFITCKYSESFVLAPMAMGVALMEVGAQAVGVVAATGEFVTFKECKLIVHLGEVRGRIILQPMRI